MTGLNQTLLKNFVFLAPICIGCLFHIIGLTLQDWFSGCEYEIQVYQTGFDQVRGPVIRVLSTIVVDKNEYGFFAMPTHDVLNIDKARSLFKIAGVFSILGEFSYIVCLPNNF